MDIELIKCVLNGRELETSGMTLKLETQASLEELKEECRPAAYIVDKNDLKHFIEFNKLVEDRGTQRATTALGKYLLKRALIPALECKYHGSRTLLNGVKGLLQSAVGLRGRGPDQNIYVIGVEGPLRLDLMSTITKINQDHGPVKQMDAQPQDKDNAPCVTGNTLSELLDDVVVGPGLEALYIGCEPEVTLVRKLITRAAPTKSTVLIIGDTGTGKELVAQGIHHLSSHTGKFIAVNCGAIPTELFESELFGILPNSATGVKGKRGLWKEADNGTLFLDEIAELLPKHQTKILRTLETGMIRPVGGLSDIPVHARVVAATNKNLLSLVKMNLFRKDLYYRLRGITIRTPSLREHPRDIPMLAAHLWEKKIKEVEHLPPDVISRLQRYSWPGNVRELKLVLFDLHVLFPKTKSLSAGHVDAVFQYQGQVVQSEEEWTSDETKRQKMESWHHLYRVYEVIIAAEMNVRSLLKSPPQDPPALAQTMFELQNRINEIEILSLYPGRFQPDAFHALAKLKRKLIDFMNCFKDDAHAAVKLMDADGLQEFSAALSCVKKEIETLTNWS